jgi:pimeloyl-ACP methyl ester carboxylesterase
LSAPLVLLHPLGATGEFWGPVVEELGGDGVLTPDLPGHGAGPVPGQRPSLEEYAASVVGLAAERGPVDLVGVSLGGLVAQHVAGRHPELVRRLVLVDTVAVYPEPMRQMWRDRAAVARERGLEELTGPMAAMWFTDGFREERDDVVSETLRRFVAGDAEGYARTCELLEDADVRPLVGAIHAPTMVVCGDNDTPPFREAAEWLAGQLPGARLEWLSGKHAVVLERPKELAALLADFLDRG